MQTVNFMRMSNSLALIIVAALALSDQHLIRSAAGAQSDTNPASNLNDLLRISQQQQQQQVVKSLSSSPLEGNSQTQYSPIDELISEALIEGLESSRDQEVAAKRSSRMYWHPTDDIGPYGMAEDNQERRVDEALNMILREISSQLSSESDGKQLAASSGQQQLIKKQLTPDGLRLLIANGNGGKLRGGRALASFGAQSGVAASGSPMVSVASSLSRDRGLTNFPKRTPTRFRPCHFNAISCPWGEF